MSSFTRRIQRQSCPSQAVHPRGEYLNGKRRTVFYANPPRKKFYNGRGSMLGVNNPKDKALLARLRREKRNAERREGGAK